MRQRMAFLRFAAVCALVVLALVFALSGCEDRSQPVKPEDASKTGGTQSQYSGLSKADARIQAAIRVQERHTQRLMASNDVVGTAVGLNDAGEVVVKIYTVREGVAGLLTSLEGEKVDVEVTGVIRAMDKPAGKPTPVPKVDHKAKQTPPIQLGTSGGWRYDLANGYCCGGTLGSLVKIGDVQYILSKYHVFRADIVSGENSKGAANGDPIIQPGLIDMSCNANNAQDVAYLAGSPSLPGSNVDAAIAEVKAGMVRTDGSILEIGVIFKNTIAAFLNQAVKKSGRTT